MGSNIHDQRHHDPIIVIAYCQMPAEEARNYSPSVVLLDEQNDVIG